MVMDSSEFPAFKETLVECKKLAKEFDISLAEVIEIRTLLILQWAAKSWCNLPPSQKPSVK